MHTETFDWRDFLVRWSAELLKDPDVREKLPEDVIMSRWLGYPAATEYEIARAEARLGIRLPPSYRAFLKVSNGWRQTSPYIYRLWSTEEIEWFAVRHQGWIDNWRAEDSEPATDEEYFVYGEEQSSLSLRPDYLQTALEISDYGDACIYVLNPRIVTDDGEWEAMFLAGWLPGASRYRSFREMIQDERATYLHNGIASGG